MAQKTDTEVSPMPSGDKPASSQPPASQSPVEAGSRSASPPPTGHPGEYFRKRPRARWYLITAILVVIFGGYFGIRYLFSYESTDDAQVDGHLMPLSARISGYVLKVNVDDNQYVPAGYVLAEIDPRDYQVAVDKARADLANAEATAQSLNINVPVTSISTSSQTTATQADVETEQANVDLAQALLKQAEDLKAAGTGTGIEVTRARVQLSNERQRLLVVTDARRRATVAPEV